MTLVKWNNNPAVFENINQWFDLITDDNVLNQEYSTKKWEPNFELYQNNNHYLIQAELAGLNKEDISIEVIDNMLKISGERKEISGEDKSKNIYSHIRYGEFNESFKLTENVLDNKISAKMEDGILKVTIPIAEPVLPESKKIMIN